MAGVVELIRLEADGKLSFGNYELAQKAKLEDFPFEGDMLKVKTYKDITKLEKDGLFVYESVPGTSVYNFIEEESGVSFEVEGNEDAQITIGLAEDTEYEVFVDENSIGTMSTGLSGKISLSVELEAVDKVAVKVVRA